MKRILLVGFGGMGHVHYVNIQRMDNAEIVGITGTEHDRKAAEKTGLPFFLSITEGIQKLSPDAVDITTPTFLHKLHVMEALECGVDVICEKPLALSASDAAEIYRTAEDKGLRVFPALVMRYTKEFAVLSSLIHNGEYGKLIKADFHRLSPMPEWTAGNWLFDKDKSGLIPFDLHIHDLDMIYALFGEPECIDSYAPVDIKTGFPCYYSIEYGYENLSVHAEAGWLRTSMPFTSGWRMIFEKAVAVNEDGRISIYPEKKEMQDLTPHYDIVISTGINVPPTGWYYEEIKHIISEMDGSEKAKISRDEAVGVLRIAERL